MSSCVFPGSFDPVTRGHMNLICRAARMFDKVTVTVMVNVHKHGSIPEEKRIALLEKACADLSNVHIDRWNGLLADYMRNRNEKIIIRGIRSAGEFEQEYTASLINRQLNEEVETLLIPADPNLNAISSSAVREIAAFGGKIGHLVPATVMKDIQELLSKQK